MSRPAIITTAGLIPLALLASLLFLFRSEPPPTRTPSPPAPAPASVPLPDDPFDHALAVLARGASTPEIAAAIEFLDTTARLGEPLSADRRSMLVSALEKDAPPGMGTGTWAHLFNSSCNALAAGGADPAPEFIALLERLAASDRRRVIRLYALQHLSIRYTACTHATRARIRSIVADILAERPVSPVAGTALVLARRWEGSSGDTRISSVLEAARLIAADIAQPVDVRVTALHTAGASSSVLDIARTLASDQAQPTILRKSALYLIGRHGTADDLPLLRRCTRESVRLAQAGDPASKTLQARLDHTPIPVLRPY